MSEAVREVVKGPAKGTGGRPRQLAQNTFALNEGEFRVIGHLTAFRKICVVVCEYMPAAKEEDLVMMRDRPQFMVGEANILEVKHIKTRGGHSTVLALQLIEKEEQNG